MVEKGSFISELNELVSDEDARYQYLIGMANFDALQAQLPRVTQGIAELIGRADALSARKRDSLLTVTAQVVMGIVEASELADSGRPGNIARFDADARGAKAARSRFHEVFAALGFVYDQTESFKETDRRLQKRHTITENHFYAPELSGTSGRLTIVEFLVDDNDLSFFAEVQPTPASAPL